MNVTRIHTDSGSHIEPPLEQHWPKLAKLEWEAATVTCDAGIDVQVRQSDYSVKTVLGWRRVGDTFDVIVAGGTLGPLGYDQAWSVLTGVLLGAEAATR